MNTSYFKIFSFSLILLLFAYSCKSSKRTKNTSVKNASTLSTNNHSPSSHTEESIAEPIIKKAQTFEGVKYKYGGMDKRGMDCSGLVTTAFKTQNIILPRTTSELSTYGNWIDLKEIKKGDLLFFATQKNSRTVNHVGIVTNTRLGEVEFIHSTTSQGVITSKLSEKYWYFAFVQARRIL
ncbi:MAG TPA: C40 family peptidase [Flavobacteriaceae bacterium]|nr:C40 family peptidase [Flavobacteriaceae bacterium]